MTGLGKASVLLFNGNDLYIGEFDDRKVSKIDITETSPTTEDVISGSNVLSSVGGLAINGNELFIAEPNTYKISKADITTASSMATEVMTDLGNQRNLVVL